MEIISSVVTFILMILLMPQLIKKLKQLKFGQTEREEGLESHQEKSGTPTMGGLSFVLIPVVVSLIFNYQLLLNPITLIVIISFIGYALIGFIDDYKIVVQKNNAGLSAKSKSLMQLGLAIVIFALYYGLIGNTTIMIPIINKGITIHPIFFFLFILLMFVAESNAVNLTDGLDGLCAGVSIFALIPFIAFAFMDQNRDLGFLLVNITIGLLVYLYFNKYPAKVFMGDTGSLALGGLFAAIALVEKKEIILLVVGLIFIIETLSVIIQVTYFRKTGKRIFKMAPIHHHFEACGMSERQVAGMFYVVAIILAIIGYLLGVM